jgi:hypothetical protein
MEVQVMQKKLTLSIDEEVYEGLRKELYKAYEEMAADTVRESEALEWAEVSFGEVDDEVR